MDHPPHLKASSRNRQFDILRLIFATFVLLSHAPEITDGNASRELIHRLTHSGITFGTLGVDGFFLLSGFLITKSWDRDPELLNYLRKRLLRIVPGYLVAALLGTFVVGMLAPGIPDFFRHLGWPFVLSLLTLGSPDTPPTFPGFHYATVNGSMWTIIYEFLCYLFVAFLGVCGIVKRRWLWLALTTILFVAMTSKAFERHLELPTFGFKEVNFEDLYRLAAIFFIGACFYLFRDKIRFLPALAVIAATLLIAAIRFIPTHAESAVVLAGGYLLFYLTQANLTRSIPVFPDISYGVYLYGWPIEALWVWYRHGSPWITFLVSVAFCGLFGWLSWHFVEQPFLKLKRHPSADLPPG